MSKQHKLMDIAKSISLLSKDKSTQVGALIVAEDGSALSWGYNGFPRGANDDVEERHQRPTKYLWTEHAERNAIYNASRNGIKLDGGNIFITSLVPCVDCARAIIQAGIKKVYIEKKALDPATYNSPQWLETWGIVNTMFNESKVDIFKLDREKT